MGGEPLGMQKDGSGDEKIQDLPSTERISWKSRDNLQIHEGPAGVRHVILGKTLWRSQGPLRKLWHPSISGGPKEMKTI